MPGKKWGIAATGAVCALALAFPALAQQPPMMPTVEMQTSSVNVGLGGQSGSGVLRLPNLGTNCAYPFRVSGFGAGIRVGVSRASAAGAVANMRRVADLAGNYSATEGEATLFAGQASSTLKNKQNDVVIGLKAQTQGLGLGFGGQGMTIEITEPPVGGPGTYVMTFGFNKDHLNQESRATLNQLVRAWKCRYVTFQVYGNTDTVGNASENLNLSELRSLAVENYLRRSGVVPTRIVRHQRGESAPGVQTGNEVRLRNNRNVIVVVQEG